MIFAHKSGLEVRRIRKSIFPRLPRAMISRANDKRSLYPSARLVYFLPTKRGRSRGTSRGCRKIASSSKHLYSTGLLSGYMLKTFRLCFKESLAWHFYSRRSLFGYQKGQREPSRKCRGGRRFLFDLDVLSVLLLWEVH